MTSGRGLHWLHDQSWEKGYWGYYKRHNKSGVIETCKKRKNKLVVAISTTTPMILAQWAWCEENRRKALENEEARCCKVLLQLMTAGQRAQCMANRRKSLVKRRKLLPHSPPLPDDRWTRSTKWGKQVHYVRATEQTKSEYNQPPSSNGAYVVASCLHLLMKFFSLSGKHPLTPGMWSCWRTLPTWMR